MARRSTPTILEAGFQYAEQSFVRGGAADMRRKNLSLTRRLHEFTNGRQVGSLTPDHVEAFFYGPRGLVKTCASTTLANYRNTLKGFLGWCYRRKWCDEPEYLLGGVTNTSTRNRRVRLRLSEAQLWAMVDACRDNRDRAMLTFAMHTGCRVSEILALRLRSLNLETGEVHVKIIKTREEDVMTVSPLLDRELRAWLAVYTEKHNPGPDDRLFPARAPNRLIDGTNHVPEAERGYTPSKPIGSPSRQIRRIADAAGVSLEDGDGWHTVRRSVARLFFDRASHMGHDAALRMTSAFLHHANTTTTEVYLGLQLEKKKRDEIMSGGFLLGPTDSVTRLDDYRKAEGG